MRHPRTVRDHDFVLFGPDAEVLQLVGGLQVADHAARLERQVLHLLRVLLRQLLRHLRKPPQNRARLVADHIPVFALEFRVNGGYGFIITAFTQKKALPLCTGTHPSTPD